jgi:septal ring factor EnvC (AmiA/AmiB activator)
MVGEHEALHLKLDQLLAGQAELARRQDEQDGTLDALAATMELFRQALGTQTEMLARLNQAASEEQQGGASEMQALLARIAATLQEIAADAGETRVVLGRLPNLLERAALDAARMMRGDGVDATPGDDAG